MGISAGGSRSKRGDEYFLQQIKNPNFIALSCNAAIIYDHIPICEVIHLKIIPLDTDRMKKQKSFSLVFEIFLSSNKIIHV